MKPVCLVWTMLAVMLAASAQATDYTWDAGGDKTNWFDSTNWNPDGIPTDGDTAFVVSAAGSTNVLLTNSTACLSTFIVSNATLTFSNWTTVLQATNVTVRSGGRLTHAPCTTNLLTNRVYVLCSSLLIESNGVITVDAKGYPGGDYSNHNAGYGPGGATGGLCGGGYGGYGGTSSGAGGGVPYGVSSAPTDPGSGGGGWYQASPFYAIVGGTGGGAVRLEVSGQAVVNGTITANGDNGTGNAPDVRSGGSGGGIFLTCGTFAGTNGILRANGWGSGGNYVRGGGGGRIAVVVTNSILQDGLPIPTVGFSALRGASGDARYYGDIGTVYLSRESLLPNLLTANYNGRLGGFSAWTRDTLIVSNGWIGTLVNDARMTVTNDLIVLGSAGRLDLSNAAVTVGGSVFLRSGGLYLYGGATNGSSLSCGRLTLTNGAILDVHAGMTNSGPRNYGSQVSVGGDVYVGSNCVIYPHSSLTNGGSLLFTMASLFVASNGQINADGMGFSGARTGTSPGFGPGHGGFYCGGGYGGTGARSLAGGPPGGGPPYGNSNAPVDPGSGGGSYLTTGGAGGGLIRIDTAGTVALHGTLTANGQFMPAGAGFAGAGTGSGGGIYVTCRTFSGSTSGVIRANGGSASESFIRTGGGGRVAVWRVRDTSGGSVSVSAAHGSGGTDENPASTDGTVVWGYLPLSGTVFSLR